MDNQQQDTAMDYQQQDTAMDNQQQQDAAMDKQQQQDAAMDNQQQQDTAMQVCEFTAEKEYNITEDPLCVPEDIRKARVLGVFVDFLEPEPHFRKNRVSLKLELHDEDQVLYSAARVSMELNHERSSHLQRHDVSGTVEGKLVLTTLVCKGPTEASAAYYVLQTMKQLTVGAVVDVLRCKNLHLFRFCVPRGGGEEYEGHRDWAAQAIYTLQAARLVGQGTLLRNRKAFRLMYTARTIFQALGMRHSQDLLEAVPIDKGYFNKYEPYRGDDLPYRGTKLEREASFIVERWETALRNQV